MRIYMKTMRNFLAILWALLPILAVAQPTTPFVKYHITLQNEATGRLIGDWAVVAQDGVPASIQSVRAISDLMRRVARAIKEAPETPVVKPGTSIIVVPHVLQNGDVETRIRLSYTTLDAIRTASIEGQTIDLPYMTTTYAENAVLTTPAKPETVFELNPQDKYMKPGDHGYGVPLMFKVAARVE